MLDVIIQVFIKLTGFFLLPVSLFLCSLVCSVPKVCCSHWLHPIEPLQTAEAKTINYVLYAHPFQFNYYNIKTAVPCGLPNTGCCTVRKFTF